MRLDGFCDGREFVRKIRAVAGNKTRFAFFGKGQRAVAVIFKLIQPFVAMGYRLGGFRKLDGGPVEGIFFCSLGLRLSVLS